MSKAELNKSRELVPNINTEPVLVRFAPVDNPHGYEMRWIQIVKNEKIFIRNGKTYEQNGRLKIWCAPINPHDTRDFPELRPLNRCDGRKSYVKQALRMLKREGAY